MAEIIQIQLRRDAAADWTSNNPILNEGELAWEVDTGYFKIGDGATAWNALSYNWFFGGDVTINGTNFTILDSSNNGIAWDGSQLAIQEASNIFFETLVGELNLYASDSADPTMSQDIESKYYWLSQEGNQYGFAGFDSGTDLILQNDAYEGAMQFFVTNNLGATFGMEMAYQQWQLNLDIQNLSETIIEVDTSGDSFDTSYVQISVPTEITRTLLVNSSDPRIRQRNGSGAVDERVWQFDVDGPGSWYLRTRNDADSSGNDAIVVARTGIVVDSITLDATDVIIDDGTISTPASTLNVNVNANNVLDLNDTGHFDLPQLSPGNDTILRYVAANSRYEPQAMQVDVGEIDSSGPWRVIYFDGSGDGTELALGADGTVLTSTGTTSAPAFETPRSFTVVTETTTSRTAAVFECILVDDDTAGSLVTIDLPAASANDEIIVKKLGTTADVRLDGNAGQTIDGATTFDLTAQYAAVKIIHDGSNWHII